jgi:ABC-type uncharacterized transport system permease subunit
MKEILLTFGSIAAILVGAILVYANVINGAIWEFWDQVYAGVGVVFLAAGITGLWMKGRLKRD